MMPLNEKGSDARNTGPLENQLTDEIIQEEALQRKRFTTAQARAAILGHQLVKVASGFMLSKWTYSRHFVDIDSVHIVLNRMEGNRGTGDA